MAGLWVCDFQMLQVVEVDVDKFFCWRIRWWRRANQSEDDSAPFPSKSAFGRLGVFSSSLESF